MRSISLFLLLLPGCLMAFQEEALFEALPKAELHLHLGGSFPKNYLLSLATPEEQVMLEEKLDIVAEGMHYHEIFPVFQIVSKLVNTEEKVQKGVEALCQTLLEDHVSYVEIRTGLKDLGEGPEAYLQAVLSGIETNLSPNFQAFVILSLQRHASLEQTQTTVDLALKYPRVIGIDISGDSKRGNIESILPELLRAKQGGLPFVVHLGETVGETDQMLLLEALNPKRVGHGVFLSDEAKRWILSHQTPIEICLSSSVLVQMIERYEEHPGFDFFRLGHPVVFCTDDPLLFSTKLSRELALAYQVGLTQEELETIVSDSFEYVLERVYE